MMTTTQKARLLHIRHDLVDNCPTCGGVGYVSTDEGGTRPCSCMSVFRWVMALVLARVPPVTWRLSPLVDDLIDPAAVGAVRSRISTWPSAVSNGIGMVFSGPNGTGKTTLGCELLKHALSIGSRAGYITANEYVNALKPNSPTAHLVPWVEALQVAFIDELDKPYGKEGSTFVASQMDGLIRAAAVNGQVLIFATNASSEELCDRYGNSFCSALERSCTSVLVAGADLSRKVQERHGAMASEAFDYAHPQIVRWAQVYEMNTYLETRTIL